jgi:hypothetical protein
VQAVVADDAISNRRKRIHSRPRWLASSATAICTAAAIAIGFAWRAIAHSWNPLVVRDARRVHAHPAIDRSRG